MTASRFPTIVACITIAVGLCSGCASFHHGPSAAELAVRDTLTFVRGTEARTRQTLSASETALAATRDSLARARASVRLMDSAYVALDPTAVDSFVVAFETTKGRFDVIIRRRWAPLGADRMYELVARRFFDSVTFHRVPKGFVAQFGFAPDSAQAARWRNRRLMDDTVRASNVRGRVSFARGGPNTRTTQLFVNIGNNARLDTANAFGFPPIGEVISGMNVVDSLNTEYASAPNNASGARSYAAAMLAAYPRLDYIKAARIVVEWRRPPGG